MGLKEALEWFDTHHRTKGNYPYSMVNRYGNPGYDCSSAVFYALIAGGALPKDINIGNTETLFKLKDKYFDEIYSYKDVKPGDIFIRGGEGTSAGASGHTGMFYKKDGIVHSNYSNNGISYNDIDSYITYYLDRKRSANERYFRPKAFIEKKDTKPIENKPKPIKQAYKWKNEEYFGITQAVCNVRTYPSLNAAIVAQYRPGQRINYDQVWVGDGHIWISYISYSRKRRYVAIGKENSNYRWIYID